MQGFFHQAVNETGNGLLNKDIEENQNQYSKIPL